MHHMNDPELHIDARMPQEDHDGDIDMWEPSTADKLHDESALGTPTTVEPFFDMEPVVPNPIKVPVWATNPRRCWRAAVNASANTGESPMLQPDGMSFTALEPSSEPCTDEIPWSDLVYWLGNASTGTVECPCPHCVVVRAHEHMLQQQQQQQQLLQQHHRLHHPAAVVPLPPSMNHSTYQRLSAKIPVINLPRIEGVN